MTKIAIQGVHGCFHEQAARLFYGNEIGVCECLSFEDLFVALDVFEEEPLSEKSSLWEFDNVAISPHNSFVSNKNNIRMFQVMYDHLKEFMLKQK